MKKVVKYFKVKLSEYATKKSKIKIVNEIFCYQRNVYKCHFPAIVIEGSLSRSNLIVYVNAIFIGMNNTFIVLPIAIKL